MSSTRVQDLVSTEEWEERIHLAACYRLIAHLGWDDLVYTHISARVPGEYHHFLINPFGKMFEEICASDLVKIDLEGNKALDSPYPVNRAGFVIHGAIHESREDARCVLHLHSDYGVAVAMQRGGLLPLSQTAIVIHPHVAYHDYEGIAVREGEKERLVADLSDKTAMILRSHGTLTVGRNVAEAFERMYFLERACKIQILAQSTGQILTPVTQDAYRNTQAAAAVMSREWTIENGPWPALLRKMDRLDPSYRN